MLKGIQNRKQKFENSNAPEKYYFYIPDFQRVIKASCPADEDRSPYSGLIGDGICQDEVNIADCHFDGGDCCLKIVNLSLKSYTSGCATPKLQ